MKWRNGNSGSAMYSIAHVIAEARDQQSAE
jgi:hypothetical protein